MAPLDDSQVNGMNFNESSLAEAVEVCDLTRLDDEEVDSSEHGDSNDGFSNWYGHPSPQDNLCRGRRESVLGSAWIDEAAYVRPPLSMLQAAPSGQGTQRKEDPSCKKLLR